MIPSQLAKKTLKTELIKAASNSSMPRCPECEHRMKEASGGGYACTHCGYKGGARKVDDHDKDAYLDDEQNPAEKSLRQLTVEHLEKRGYKSSQLEAVKHLRGQHDQADHGRHGGGAADAVGGGAEDSGVGGEEPIPTDPAERKNRLDAMRQGLGRLPRKTLLNLKRLREARVEFADITHNKELGDWERERLGVVNDILKAGERKPKPTAGAEAGGDWQSKLDAVIGATEKPKPAVSTTDYSQMSLGEIAGHMRRAWNQQKGGVYFGAAPYLSSLSGMQDMSSRDMTDDASTVVGYLLANASTFRGPEAKAIKDELKRRLKGARGTRKALELLTKAFASVK